jgi:hypothetical protein
MKAATVYPMVLTIATLAAGLRGAGAEEVPTYSLRSTRQAGQIDRVTILLEAAGDLLMRSGPRGEKNEKTPMSLVFKRQYDEKTLELPAAGAAAKRWRSVRWYDDAEATLDLAHEPQKLTLSPGHRLIGLEVAPNSVTHFCPRGPLSLAELELVRTVGDSLSLDALLPSEAVPSGRKWKIPDEVVTVLADLEQVKTNTVETLLKEVTPRLARLELAGRVEGTRDGATVRIDLAAKCRFDRASGRIDWFAMKFKQQQDISLAEDGLNLEALVQIRIAPVETSEHLAEAALADLPLRPTDALSRVLYQPPDGTWQLLHDRSWFQTSHTRQLYVFHRIDRGQDVGLCKISPKTKVAPEKVISLEQFQAEVREALDKNFGEVLEAAQLSTEAGCQAYRVVVKGSDKGLQKGTESDIPTRWHYYLVFDPQGRQAAFAFRIEESKVEAFGKADEPLIQSFRFVEGKKD